MSKVEVKKGDTWATDIGELMQVRGDKWRSVANERLGIGEWHAAGDTSEYALDEQIAHFWIKRVGGTVVEEREDEKAKGCERTLFMYKGATGYLNFYDHALSLTTQKMHDIRFVGTTTIHIAGVTT